jgi:hypothetical protein
MERRVVATARLGGNNHVGLQLRLVAHFGEIGGGSETGVPHRFETLNLVAQCAGEFAVDVERAAAHAGDRAHLLHARIGELADDERLAGTERVAQDTGDLDLEGLGLRALENGPHFALLTGLQFVERKDRGVRGLGGERPGERGENRQETGESAHYSDNGGKHQGIVGICE